MNRILFVRRKKKKPEESLAKNYRVHCVDSDMDAWNVLDKEKFDAILLWMEEDSAIEEKRLTQWKDHVEWNLVPVIAVLPKGSSVTEEDCFEWGDGRMSERTTLYTCSMQKTGICYHIVSAG